MDFNEQHYKQFEGSAVGDWRGRTAAIWIKSVKHTLASSSQGVLINKPFSRTDLFRLSRDRSISTLDLCVFVFAWGGMQPSNGKQILKNTEWVEVADSLRSDEFDHHQGYERFFRLSRAGKMPGCLPAYYTKLLFYLPRDGERGIIMDQWTARSINLLTGTQLVKLLPYNKGKSFRVSPDNGTAVYKNFCATVRELATCLNRPVEEIEMRMFSEGNGKGDWRNYVRAVG